MVQVELTARDPVKLLGAPALLDRLADSMRWDRLLPYVRRDVYRYVGHVDAHA